MKTICSVCGKEGFLQVRGKSRRVGHYRGFKGKTRVVEWHALTAEVVINKKTVINKEEKNKLFLNRFGETRRELEPFGGIWTRDHYLTK